MIVATRVAFSGVPEGTYATVERDGDLFKVTWIMARNKPLVDWFTPKEFGMYLEIMGP